MASYTLLFLLFTSLKKENMKNIAGPKIKENKPSENWPKTGKKKMWEYNATKVLVK
jgi:hypothetical protein